MWGVNTPKGVYKITGGEQAALLMQRNRANTLSVKVRGGAGGFRGPNPQSRPRPLWELPRSDDFGGGESMICANGRLESLETL